MSTALDIEQVVKKILQADGRSLPEIEAIAAKMRESAEQYLTRLNKVDALAGGDALLVDALKKLAQHRGAFDALEALPQATRQRVFAAFKSKPNVLIELGRVIDEAPTVAPFVQRMIAAMPSQFERIVRTAMYARGRRGASLLRAAADTLTDAELTALGADLAKLPGARAAAARFEAFVIERVVAKLNLPTGLRRYAPALVRWWNVFDGAMPDLDAIRRIVRKRRLAHRKGQLLEELLPRRIAKLRESAAGRAWLGIEGVDPSRVVVIEGHRIRDAAGRQLTDGIVAVKEEGGLRVVRIFEAKAGETASRGLELSTTVWDRLTKKQKVELERYARDIFTDPDRVPVPGETLESIKKQLLDALGEGQISRDLERLGTDAWTQIRVLVAPGDPPKVPPTFESTLVRVTRNETKFAGVVPGDVDLTDTAKFLTDKGFRFDPLTFDGVTADDLAYAAQDLAGL